MARPTNEEISRAWRAEVEPGYRWRSCANQSGTLGTVPKGESGGMMVECDQFPGRRAYLKPRKRDPDPRRARAAREKICSDLAFDVGLRVPPVVLGSREDPNGEERHVCVSLVLYPRQYSWDQVRSLVQLDTEATMQLRRALPQCASTALVFDVWVGQTDHNDHPHNIVFGYEPSDPETGRYIFLDYAMALGWGGAWQRDCCATLDVPFPALMLSSLDKRAVLDTIDRIETLQPGAVEEVVRRIPTTHLEADEGSTIVRGLLERQRALRKTISERLGGLP